jgi:hypothetical protein
MKGRPLTMRSFMAFAPGGEAGVSEVMRLLHGAIASMLALLGFTAWRDSGATFATDVRDYSIPSPRANSPRRNTSRALGHEQVASRWPKGTKADRCRVHSTSFSSCTRPEYRPVPRAFLPVPDLIIPLAKLAGFPFDDVRAVDGVFERLLGPRNYPDGPTRPKKEVRHAAPR